MIYVFYHVVDLDGQCSGAIVKYFYSTYLKQKDIELVPFNYNYKLKLDNFKKDDIVYFVDVVPSPCELLYEVAELVKEVIIFDHHKTFIDSPVGQYFKQQPKCLLQIDFAGCQLTWQGLFPEERRMPPMVHLLGEYDRWNDTHWTWSTQVLPFQYGMRLDKTDPNEYFEYWQHWFDARTQWPRIQEVIDKGKTVLIYEDLQNERIMRASFEHNFIGIDGSGAPVTYKCICVNSTTRNSALFKSVWDVSKYDAMIAYSQTKHGDWSFSGYTTKDDIDVSLIGKQFGGGGHRKAAGWMLKNLNGFFN